MAKSIKKSIMTSQQVFKQSTVNTKDEFFVLSAEQVTNMQGVLKQISASDYAVANQARTNPNCVCSNGKYGTVYWTSDYYIKGTIGGFNQAKRAVKVVDAEGYLSHSDQNVTSLVVAPAFQVSVKDLKNAGAVLKHNGIYQTVVFPDMQYPQSKVSDALAERLEFFFQTENPKPSAYYMGSTTAADGKSWKDEEKDYEYVYEGERYVRVVAESKSAKNMNFFADRTTCEDGKAYWFKVEPIKWIVVNWDSTSLNPNAFDKGDTVLLRSEEGLIGGLPFYIDKNDSNGILWQNSYIRSMLNGTNLRSVIDNGNGAKGNKASTNIDFSGEKSKASFKHIVFKDEAELVETKEVNPYGITISTKPKTVDEQLAFYIEKGQSFMLHGPSGVGKTRRVQELDPDFVMIRLRNGILPEEIIGKTAYENGVSSWIEPTWFTQIWDICKREPKKNHVLLIDELTNVKENEQSLVYDIVLERSINGKEGRLPDNCVIVSTGNNPKESSAAYNMPEPLFRRFYAHIYLEPDVKSFLQWGGQPHKKFPNRPKVHPAVLSFIAAKGIKALCTPYDSEEPPEHAVDPRSWEQVSDILFAGHGEFDYNLIKNKVGDALARDFLAFVKIPPITIDSIVKGTYDIGKLPKDANSKYALMLSLRWADANQLKAVRKFIKDNLGEENLANYDLIWSQQSDEHALFLQEMEDEEDLENIDA